MRVLGGRNGVRATGNGYSLPGFSSIKANILRDNALLRFLLAFVHSITRTLVICVV